MKKIITLLTISLLFSCTSTQKVSNNNKAPGTQDKNWNGTVVYETHAMGMHIQNITFKTIDGFAKITTENASNGNVMMQSSFKEEMFLDFNNKRMHSFHKFNDGECLKIEESLDGEANKLTYTDETKEILGYKCTKGTFTSEMMGQKMTITIWVAKNVGIKASPNFTGANDGLVLEIDNGNTKTTAKSVKSNNVKEKISFPTYGCKKVSEQELMDKIMDSY